MHYSNSERFRIDCFSVGKRVSNSNKKERKIDTVRSLLNLDQSGLFFGGRTYIFESMVLFTCLDVWNVVVVGLFLVLSGHSLSSAMGRITYKGHLERSLSH